MAAPYSLRLFTPAGGNLDALADYAGFALAYGQGVVGVCTVTLGNKWKTAQAFPPFTRLEVWRSVGGITYLEGERIWYLLDQADYRDAQGRQLQQLTFYDANYILAHRYILAAAESAEADKTDNADDMLKDIVKETIGSEAIAARQVTGLTVAADNAAATSITKAFHGRRVIDILNEVCAKARDNDEALFYDFVRTAENTLEFRTFMGQRGTNRGKDSAAPLRLTWEGGNLREPSITYNRYGAANYIHAAGQGIKGARVTKYATDAVPPTGWARLEYFKDCRNVESETEVQTEADAVYEERRPKVEFEGSLSDTLAVRYGRDLLYGDRVWVEYAGWQFEAHITNVSLSVSPTGVERLSVKLRNFDEPIPAA